ncbi:MAG: D-alanyl-D-alanine carboxypeptidase family protein [Leptolyngbyaceae cyanobacterium T60_A2020_046]|nr:D-alanyl-D-alanine carboxypeptidase family protein [Leptolyngbyaceae cyanobacterium T60_A2020_046]
MVKPKSLSSTDDLPEAQRDLRGRVSVSVAGGRRWPRWTKWVIVACLSAITGLLASWLTYQSAESTPIAFESGALRLDGSAINASSGSDSRTLLGHRAYEEAPTNSLVPLSMDGGIQLRQAAARQFEAMIADAAAEGVRIIPLSGFRSIEDQQYLFFNIKAERGQTTRTRAEVSAPPGYSEHHTGYAVDVGDGSRPNLHLEVEFEQTPAFQWLAQNAARYSFELSFPPDNDQGIQYEPWHWRFVGDSDSLETFYRDR